VFDRICGDLSQKTADVLFSVSGCLDFIFFLKNGLPFLFWENCSLFFPPSNDDPDPFLIFCDFDLFFLKFLLNYHFCACVLFSEAYNIIIKEVETTVEVS